MKRQDYCKQFGPRGSGLTYQWNRGCITAVTSRRQGGRCMDFRQFYDLESYLFDTVRTHFRNQGYLSTFDFFCIVIWKANRAKSRVAKTLLAQGHGDLNDAVRTLTAGLSNCATAKERLRNLLENGFR